MQEHRILFFVVSVVSTGTIYNDFFAHSHVTKYFHNSQNYMIQQKRACFAILLPILYCSSKWNVL